MTRFMLYNNILIKMEQHCSTSQSPQWAVVPMEEEEEYSNIVGQQLFKGYPDLFS